MLKKVKEIFCQFNTNYIETMLEENADNLKQYEISPGIYSNVDPASLKSVGASDFDLVK